MRDFRNIIFVLIVLTFILQIYVTNKDAEKAQESTSSKPIVAVSTFAIYDITKSIAANSIEIVNILPFGVDAHSFEPTPKLMVALEKSKLVIYSGAGLEPWTEGFDFKSRVLDISKYVKLRELKPDEFDRHSHHDNQCAHSKIDPHYWLDIGNMIIATNTITQELIAIFPQNKQMYTQNAQKYMKKLELLDQDYKRALSSCSTDTIITNHNAFSYLSKKYNFHVEALSGLSPETEPSAKDITRLMKHIKEERVSTIFFESFVSDKVMKSIAHDVDVKVDVLQPLGNITENEFKRSATYEDIMRENLKKLSKALMCR